MKQARIKKPQKIYSFTLPGEVVVEALNITEAQEIARKAIRYYGVTYDTGLRLKGRRIRYLSEIKDKAWRDSGVPYGKSRSCGQSLPEILPARPGERTMAKLHKFSADEKTEIRHLQQLLPKEPKIAEAVCLLATLGQYDGSHHKQWAIDQSLRLLLQDQYLEILGEELDPGIAPLVCHTS